MLGDVRYEARLGSPDDLLGASGPAMLASQGKRLSCSALTGHGDGGSSHVWQNTAGKGAWRQCTPSWAPWARQAVRR